MKKRYAAPRVITWELSNVIALSKEVIDYTAINGNDNTEKDKFGGAL